MKIQHLDAGDVSSSLEALQVHLKNTPSTVDVAAWQVGAADVWPLICTTLESLAIQIHVASKGVLAKGSWAWRSAIAMERRLASMRPMPDRGKGGGPEGGLDGTVVHCGTRFNGRVIGGVPVSAPLDIPAFLLAEAGERTIVWYEDVGPSEAFLATVPHTSARGLRDLLAEARKAGFREAIIGELLGMPKYAGWCAATAKLLRFEPKFLSIWISRQIDHMLAMAKAYSGVFERHGRPKAVFMLNSGHASTAALALAARNFAIPLVEVQHGAERESALTRAGATPHFTSFNTMPNAFVAWDVLDRGDRAVACVGPIDLQLPRVLGMCKPTQGSALSRLKDAMRSQEARLDARIAAAGRISSQFLISAMGDESLPWLEAVVSRLPKDAFVWIRRHPSDRQLRLPPHAPFDVARMDVDVASEVPLGSLLARVDLHITRFSAVTLEAAAMGVPTVALDKYAATLFTNKVPEHLLVCDEDVSKLAGMVQAARPRASQALALPDVERISTLYKRFARNSRP